MAPELEALLADMIPRTAATLTRIKRQYPNAVGTILARDDIEQEMWLAALENKEVLGRHFAAGNEAAIRTVLMTGAQRIIRDEIREQRVKKAKEEGYEPWDEVYYSIGSLRQLLPMYLDMGGVTEHASQGREQAGPVSGGGSGYGDHLVTMIDVDRAFKALSPAKQKILSRYFAYPQGKSGWTHLEIAGAMGMPPKQLASRVHHALRALQAELGGQNPWRRGPAPR